MVFSVFKRYPRPTGRSPPSPPGSPRTCDNRAGRSMPGPLFLLSPPVVRSTRIMVFEPNEPDHVTPCLRSLDGSLSNCPNKLRVAWHSPPPPDTWAWLRTSPCSETIHESLLLNVADSLWGPAASDPSLPPAGLAPLHRSHLYICVMLPPPRACWGQEAIWVLPSRGAVITSPTGGGHSVHLFWRSALTKTMLCTHFFFCTNGI